MPSPLACRRSLAAPRASALPVFTPQALTGPTQGLRTLRPLSGALRRQTQMPTTLLQAEHQSPACQ